MWVIEKSLPNGALYRNKENPKLKKLEIFLDPTWQVSASSDDCYVKREDSSIYLTEFEVRVGYASALQETYDAGLRFTNVTIPRGAKIESAYLTLIAYTGITIDASAIIRGEASNNPSTFSTYSDFISRPRTANSVVWSMPPTESGASYDTPDISNIIQEIVNRPGWSPGNALVIFLEYYSGSYRRWDSYDLNPRYAAKLTVFFTVLVSDSGSGVDSAFAGLFIDGLDSGLGEDSVTVTADIKASDAGASMDLAFTIGYILADDFTEGWDSVSAGFPVSANDEGFGVDVSLRTIKALGDDYCVGEDSAEAHNPLLEAISKLLNCIIQITPIAIISGIVSLATKIRKLKAKP